VWFCECKGPRQGTCPPHHGSFLPSFIHRLGRLLGPNGSPDHIDFEPFPGKKALSDSSSPLRGDFFTLILGICHCVPSIFPEWNDKPRAIVVFQGFTFSSEG